MIDLITLALALKKSKAYTDSAIAALPHGVRYQGEVNYYADLPAAPNLGDYKSAPFE